MEWGKDVLKQTRWLNAFVSGGQGQNLISKETCGLQVGRGMFVRSFSGCVQVLLVFGAKQHMHGPLAWERCEMMKMPRGPSVHVGASQTLQCAPSSAGSGIESCHITLAGLRLQHCPQHPVSYIPSPAHLLSSALNRGLTDCSVL
jgi:hypothetical protein